MLGAMPADEIEDIWWCLVVFTAMNARTDQERELATIGRRFFAAAGLIQAGPEGEGPRLMWRSGGLH